MGYFMQHSECLEHSRGEKKILDVGEVYPALRHAIIDLYLRPGAIMSIKDICEHFQMGRSPVRDALMRLNQEGLVTLLPQRGTMISHIDLSRVEQERFLRLAVEEEVMKLFMACYTHSDSVPLEDNLRQQQELCEQEDIDIRRFLWLDDCFHSVFYGITNKKFCLQTLQNSGGHYRRMRLLTCDKLEVEENLRQHNALLAALQSRDTEAMCDVFHFHLQKLDRKEQVLLKKYPYLFKNDDSVWNLYPALEADYLQTLNRRNTENVPENPLPGLHYKETLEAK